MQIFWYSFVRRLEVHDIHTGIFTAEGMQALKSTFSFINRYDQRSYRPCDSNGNYMSTKDYWRMFWHDVEVIREDKFQGEIIMKLICHFHDDATIDNPILKPMRADQDEDDKYIILRMVVKELQDLYSYVRVVFKANKRIDFKISAMLDYLSQILLKGEYDKNEKYYELVEKWIGKPKDPFTVEGLATFNELVAAENDQYSRDLNALRKEEENEVAEIEKKYEQIRKERQDAHKAYLEDLKKEYAESIK
jgi:hypothetical protein